jgi:hypothetical protein
MSILVRFTGAPSMNTEKYDATMTALETAGAFPADGLEFHVAFTSGGSSRRRDLESMEKFDAFTHG